VSTGPSLLLDSSNGLKLSLLKEGECIAFKNFERPRFSEYIHQEIFSLLMANKVSLSELEYLVYFAGPGSYTGLRVVEGIANVFEFCDTRVISFSWKEFFEYSNLKEFIWLENAFKNEIYLVYFDQAENRVIEKRIEAKCFDSFLSSKKDWKLNTHTKGLAGGKIQYTDLSELLKSNQKVIKMIFDKKPKVKIKYFRPIEQEFLKK
jgi:tRNA threonylcarbamoyladenosine biosynthesis protein TsaB